ncbi:hypothetical protein J421_3793 [Gemmatirosa kalamazoonensis]|uniref:Uncharacterized protein n=1 Tax=Gemmatirosa kalamazoonensis TaxID=861299 RepID=W0RLZ3_9BACT|nr:hypothetical protein [Gemmatirosa kalamazoonensis]AHG91330.1 hypothetical protein J421_3793 [Gemmatirosa kalamazoonensis]
MEARAIPAAAAPLSRAHEQSAAAVVPWPLVATLFAATSIVVGIIWDISWHMSIGRDTFWTPAHMGIYVGGLVAGGANGFLVLHTTFAGSEAQRARSVRIWGMRGPLGAWVAIWGAGAMLTSAPFDDWWHNAYGLDVQVLSPPHSVLIAGILGVVFGAAITALTAQNRAESGDGGAAMAARAGLFRAIYAYALGVVLTIVFIGVWQDMHPGFSHGAHFYRAAAYPLPFVLCAALPSLRVRWPATATALVYTAIFAAMTWTLPLFPATPKLGPIFQPITHFVPMGFPLLLVVPAVLFDLAYQRAREANRWLLAAVLGTAFIASLLAVYWWFGAFLMSPASHNWFFAGGNYNYNLPPTSRWYRGLFFDADAPGAEFWRGMAWAVGIAIVTSRLGLAFGDWMRRVRR